MFAFALLLDCTKINFVTYQLLLTATSQWKDVFFPLLEREKNVNGRCSWDVSQGEKKVKKTVGNDTLKNV